MKAFRAIVATALTLLLSVTAATSFADTASAHHYCDEILVSSAKTPYLASGGPGQPAQIVWGGNFQCDEGFTEVKFRLQQYNGRKFVTIQESVVDYDGPRYMTRRFAKKASDVMGGTFRSCLNFRTDTRWRTTCSGERYI